MTPRFRPSHSATSRHRSAAWLAASIVALGTSMMSTAFAQARPAPEHTSASRPPAPLTPNGQPSSHKQATPDPVAEFFAEGPTQKDAMGQDPAPTEPQLRKIFFDAVRAAVERSPKVKAASANHQASLSDVDQAKGERWPQVDVGTQTRSLQGGTVVEGTPQQGNQLTMTVTTNIFDFGRIRNNIGSREESANAAQQAYQAEREAIAFDVSSTLVELTKQRLIVELSRQYVDRMERLVAMLREIVAVDRGRSSELTQARSKVLQAQASRDSAQMKVRDAELNLRKLVGEHHPVMLPRTSAWPLQSANLDALLSEVDQHPSIAQAQAAAKAAQLEAATVRSASMPSVNWVISANAGRDAYGRQQPWQTNITANWPLFRGGSADAAYKAALSRADASRDAIDQHRLDLTNGVRTANLDSRSLLERADLYASLSTETDSVRRAFFEQWYHLGKRTLLDVLTAESDYYGNLVSEVSTRFDGYQAVFREYSQAGILSRWLEQGF